MDLIGGLEDSDEKAQLVSYQNRLITMYNDLSAKYHSEKGSNIDNSLVLG